MRRVTKNHPMKINLRKPKTKVITRSRKTLATEKMKKKRNFTVTKITNQINLRQPIRLIIMTKRRTNFTATKMKRTQTKRMTKAVKMSENSKMVAKVQQTQAEMMIKTKGNLKTIISENLKNRKKITKN